VRADWAIVDDETPGVVFGKGWRQMWCPNGEQVNDWSHICGGRDGGERTQQMLAEAEPTTYALPVKTAGRYALHFKVPYLWWVKPGRLTAIDITSGGKTVRATYDQGYAMGQWQKIGEYDLAPGATLAIIPSASKGPIFADGFALVPTAPAENGK
jgi:hypothetical protein